MQEFGEQITYLNWKKYFGKDFQIEISCKTETLRWETMKNIGEMGLKEFLHFLRKCLKAGNMLHVVYIMWNNDLIYISII